MEAALCPVSDAQFTDWQVIPGMGAPLGKCSLSLCSAMKASTPSCMTKSTSWVRKPSLEVKGKN